MKPSGRCKQYRRHCFK
uniref:Uncharacterized protein n=1 Tax=Arundo donax TaxID=35708 RepID=A0A0A8ZAS4_ARUDO